MEKEFLLHDIAKLEYGNKFDKNKMTHNEPCYNFVGRTEKNNGITDFVDDNGTEPFAAGTITLAFGGSIGSTFIQPKPYYTSQNVGVITLPGEVSENAKIYFIKALEKVCKNRYVAFADEINKHFKTDLALSLPVIPSADPSHVYTPADIDWGCMERCIAELEEERIAELAAYLQASGLDDCELTPQDEQALAEEPPFAEFRVGDVFKPLKLKKYAKVPTSEGDVPFVSCKVTDNGIASYCGEAPEVEHCITVSTNGNCFDCFWHDYPIIPSSDVEVLHLEGVTDNRERAVYICGVLAPNSALYSYTNKPKNGKVFDTKILLPVVPSADPSHVYTPADIDWGCMERYIRATEKLVMADVVAYKDRVIAETKRIVRQNGSHTAAGEAQPC